MIFNPKLLKNEINISEEEVKSIYTLLVLNSRGKFDEKVNGYECIQYNAQLKYSDSSDDEVINYSYFVSKELKVNLKNLKKTEKTKKKKCK